MYKAWSAQAVLLAQWEEGKAPKNLTEEMGVDLRTSAIEKKLRQVEYKGSGIITEYHYRTEMEEEAFYRFIRIRHPGEGYWDPKVELISREGSEGYRVYLLQDYSLATAILEEAEAIANAKG